MAISRVSRTLVEARRKLIVAWIIVRNNATPFISIPIDDDMNARFDMVSYAKPSRERAADNRITARSCSPSAKRRVSQG